MTTNMHNIMKFSKEFLLYPTTANSTVPSSKILFLKITNMANLKDAEVIFELGCGSGAIARDVVSNLSENYTRLPFDIQLEILKGLCESNSIRAVLLTSGHTYYRH